MKFEVLLQVLNYRSHSRVVFWNKSDIVNKNQYNDLNILFWIYR